MHSPFAQPGWQVAQQLGVPVGLAGDFEGEAVQEVVVDDRDTTSLHPLAARFEPDAHGEAVLLGQGHGQLEDVVASPISEAMPVQVRGSQAGTDHGLQLCAELALHLVQPSSREQVRDPSWGEQLAVLVQQ